MKNLSKLSIGAVAAGSIAVPAGAVTIQTFNIPNQGGTTPITIGGSSTAQYNYSSSPNLGPKNIVLFYTAALTGGNNSMGNIATVSGPVALPDINGPFNSSTAILGQSFGGPPSGRYLPLKFQINGVDAVGNAFVTNTGGLEKIEYATVGGVPEPAIWAELVAGFGLAGAAMRRRRPQAALAA